MGSSQSKVPLIWQRVIYVVFTLVAFAGTAFLRLLGMGWLTVLMISIPVMPVHALMYIWCGLSFAADACKTADEIYNYRAMLVFCLAYAITFADIGDTRATGAIPFLMPWFPPAPLMIISIICFIASFYFMVRLRIATKQKRKALKAWKMQQNRNMD